MRATPKTVFQTSPLECQLFAVYLVKYFLNACKVGDQGLDKNCLCLNLYFISTHFPNENGGSYASYIEVIKLLHNE